VIEIVEDVSDGVFALRASGLVTAEEYAEVVRPAFHDFVHAVEHLRALVILERDFAYERGGDWGAAADGVLQLPQWRRLGVVTDDGSIRRLAPLASLYLRGSVRAFPMSRLPHALSWLDT
jgi:hypothetical protein